MKINTALIMCAGFGKRLNPLTLKTPKPILKLNNVTFLENTINLIKKLGIKKIMLNTFHLENQIQIFIKENKFDVDIESISDGNEILDTGGGILNMISYSSEENFIIFNPDTIWNFEYVKYIQEMENFYFKNEIKNILMVVNKQHSFDQNLKGNFELFDNKLIKKELNNYIFTGCHILNKSIFESINDKIFSINNVWDNLISKNKLFGFESNENFYHVSNLKIYKKLTKD